MSRTGALTDDQVRAIRASTNTLAAIGAEYNIITSVVSRIRTGALYASVPDVTPDGTFIPYDADRAAQNRRHAGRLSDERVDFIRKLIARRVPSNVIARHLNVNESVVDKLRIGITYRNAGVDTAPPPRRRTTT